MPYQSSNSGAKRGSQSVGGGGWGRGSQSSSPNPPNFAAALLSALLLLPLVTVPIADEFTAKYVASHAPPGAYTDKDIQDAVDYFNRQLESESEQSTHKKPAAAGGGWGGGRLQGSHPPPSQPAASGGGWGGRSQFSNGTRRDDPAENKVYVGNLPPGCTKPQLTALFRIFGQIIGIFINSQKRFAFVTFSNPADAAKALAEAKHVFVEAGESYEIRVDVMREQPSFRTGGARGCEAASFDRRPATGGGAAAVAGSQSLHVPKDPNNLFAKLRNALRDRRYVSEELALDFTKYWIGRNGNKNPGEFTSKDVEKATNSFFELVAPHDILGIPERGSILFESLPSALKAKICLALKMSAAGSSGLSDAYVVPNAYLFIAGEEGTPDGKTLHTWSHSGVCIAPLIFFTWNADLRQFVYLDEGKRLYGKDLVLAMPKCIGHPKRSNRFDVPIIPNGGYSHILQDNLVAKGGEYRTGSVEERDVRRYSSDGINQIETKMCERLSKWCDLMEAMGAISLRVHFQQEASTSASADPYGEEDSTSSNPWGAAASSVSSNPWGAAAP